MNNFANTIALSLLSKDINHCSLAELKQLAEQHPYAGSLQLLYAQKLKEQNSNDFAAQWQKTLLYFNNPVLLQHAVADTGFVPKTKTENTKPSFATSITEPKITASVGLPEELLIDGDEQHPSPIPALHIEPIDPKTAALSYTPYHTVDYFASLGIKLSEDVRATDRFGNQLKSFTSWLKEMRRLPETEIGSKISNLEQNKVVKMAETSLTGDNANTEAMAQVWIKQNNPQKAIEIYKKLSLQNPAKSAFFAAKIEHLKKQL